LLPALGSERYEVLAWVMFQMAGVGPMFGQYNHFARFAPEKVPYAIDRYTRESSRLLQVTEHRLANRQFMGKEYSIADILLFPWMDSLVSSPPQLFEQAPRVREWMQRLWARPAVQRGMKVPQIER